MAVLTQSTMTSPARDPSQLEDIGDEGDRPSITETHGTVAHFEMVCSPAPSERHPFGPPLRSRLPSLAYLAFGILIASLVGMAYQSHGVGLLYTWIVEGDRTRAVASPVLATMVVVSGLATVLRAHMRGVIVHGDGVEMRDVLLLGVPTVRRWAWAQIHRIVVDDTTARTKIALELWDNSYQQLPEVAKGKELAELLERIGAARKIATTHLARK
jgi:hypothetical protein